MSSTPFKGALKGKRKTDLSEIAAALGISVHAKRDELEEDIRKHLVSNRSKLESDSRFGGLYNSLDRGERKAGKAYEGSSDSDAGSPYSPRTPLKHTQKIVSRVNGAASEIMDQATALSSQVRARAQQATEDLSLDSTIRRAQQATEDLSLSSTIQGAQVETQHAIEEASRAAHTVVRRSRSMTKATEKSATRFYHNARDFFSDASNLTRLLLAFEAVLLIATIYPTRTYTFGASKTERLMKHGTLDGFNSPRWSLVLPDPLGYFKLDKFWQPILLWTAWTVAIPSLAAHLITFQKRHEPSPVTFAYVRLALLVFLTSSSSLLVGGTTGSSLPTSLGVSAVLPFAEKVGLISTLKANTSYGLVPLDEGLQVLLTGLVAALATYEAMATRGR